MKAEGGDVVFLDPKTGELLALASRQAAAGGVPSAPPRFTDPVRAGLAPPSCSPRRRCCCTTGWTAPTRCSRESGDLAHADRPAAGGPARITDAHATHGQPDAGAGHPGLQQHRDGEVLLPALARRSSSRCCATSASARRPAPSFPAESRGRLARARPMAADVHPGQPRDGLRVRGDAGAARGGLRRDRQRRHPARADAGARGARPGGQVLYRHQPEPVRRVVPLGDRGAAAGVPARRRRARAAPARRRSWPTTRCWARPAPRCGSRTAATCAASTPPRSRRSSRPIIPSSW